MLLNKIPIFLQFKGIGGGLGGGYGGVGGGFGPGYGNVGGYGYPPGRGNFYI